MVELEGFEADDLIGTLARAGSSQGAEVSIVSGDEDLFQLVNDRVRVLKPSRAGSDGETLCDAEKVKEILGVEPAQVVDWLALTGDPSDNIPGARPLPGHEPPIAEGGKKRSYIGPKGATELIQQFGTLEKALENYEQVKKQSYRDALRDFRNEALLSRELATIRTDVPVETSLAQLQVTPLDITELTALCQELGFTSLLREFLEEAPAPAEAATESKELTTPQAVEQWLQSTDRSATLALAMGVEGDEGLCRPPDRAWTCGRQAARHGRGGRLGGFASRTRAGAWRPRAPQGRAQLQTAATAAGEAGNCPGGSG